MRTDRPGCFNPCSAGSPTSANTAQAFSTSLRFQSLFCWITHFGQRWTRGSTRRWRGFNPCSAGSPTSAHTGRVVLTLVSNVSILVLLDHPLRPARAEPFAGRDVPGFNPCSAGSPTSASALRVTVRVFISMFQSLFCWITHFGLGWGRAAVLPEGGVSILVLLDHPLRPRRRERGRGFRYDVSILVLLDHPLRPGMR